MWEKHRILDVLPKFFINMGMSCLTHPPWSGPGNEAPEVQDCLPCSFYLNALPKLLLPAENTLALCAHLTNSYSSFRAQIKNYLSIQIPKILYIYLTITLIFKKKNHCILFKAFFTHHSLPTSLNFLRSVII